MAGKASKKEMAAARMMRARLCIGMGGATPGAVQALRRAFGGFCLDPRPAPIVKARIQMSLGDDVAAVCEELARLAGCELVALEPAQGGRCAGFAFFRRLP
jgi:hypothetical protein